jgi:hypothetical protein
MTLYHFCVMHQLFAGSELRYTDGTVEIDGDLSQKEVYAELKDKLAAAANPPRSAKDIVLLSMSRL